MSLFTVNRATLVGRLGADAEGKFTQSGVHVIKMRVATDHSYKKGEEWINETDWHQVILWRRENLLPRLVKGTRVFVEGRISTRKYQDQSGADKYVTEIIADNVIELGKGEKNGGGGGFPENAPEPRHASAPPAQQRSAPAAPYGGGFGGEGITDDDVPF